MKGVLVFIAKAEARFYRDAIKWCRSAFLTLLGRVRVGGVPATEVVMCLYVVNMGNSDYHCRFIFILFYFFLLASNIHCLLG